MRPVVFGKTMGWIGDAAGRRGVVIAGSHGFEDLCSRRFLTLLADRIAADGSPVLQFDYAGCGDAAGDHADRNRLDAWARNLGDAIDCLKAETGVTEIVLVGFRLGALLAIPVALRRDDVAGLALLAPPASGRAFVRELSALSRMIDATLPPPPEAEQPSFDGLQVAGFRLSKETVDDLRAFDPFNTCVSRSPFARVLVMCRNETHVADGLVSRLEEFGANAAAVPFTGYNKLMCDPTANEIPSDVIERCAGWVGADAPAQRPMAVADSAPRRLKAPAWEEEPVTIGPAPRMAAVLCRPRSGRADRPAFILLNAGAVPHVGWARGTVEIARALAAKGIASLRLDLPGLGQSEAHEDERLYLYDSRTSADVVRAVDWMAAAGFRRIGLAGTCSGAFQAFHAARADVRVEFLAMVNPLCFAWNASYALEMTVWKAYESSKVTLGQSKAAPVDEPSDDGRSGLRSMASFIVRRSIRRTLELIKSSLSRLSPAMGVGRNPVERWMRDLTARGTKVLMVNSEGDLSLQEVARHFGPDGERLRAMSGVSSCLIPAADHTLTPLHARRLLCDRLVRLVGPVIGEEVPGQGPVPAERPKTVRKRLSVAAHASGAAKVKAG